MEGNDRVAPFVDSKFAVSVISEIELLGWPNIKHGQISTIRNLLKNCLVIELTPEIKNLAISLKQNNKIKLPDAVIAATALYLDIPILTADKDFAKVKNIDLLLLK